MKILNVGCNIDPERLSEDVQIEEISVDELSDLQNNRSEIVVWNNNFPFSPDLLQRIKGAHLLVNWGTYNGNLPDLSSMKDLGINARTTSGYCTNTVANFGFQQLREDLEGLGEEDVVGFIGMGKISYTLAQRIQTESSAQIAYHSPTPKAGWNDRFRYLDLQEIQRVSKILIIAANHGESLVDCEALGKNPHAPTVLNLSMDSAFPVTEIEELIQSGKIGRCISDNKPPSDRTDLSQFYTGHKAYKSEEAKEHKHFILQGLINRLKARRGQNDFSIYIARHGKTEWNRDGKFQGRLNSNLTEEGIQQAKSLANFLANKNIGSIHASPLGRSVQTAQLVSEVLGVPFRVVDRLVEMNFGCLQGQPKTSINDHPKFLQRRAVDKLRTAYPDGESYYDVALRVQRDVDRAISLGENALMIGHESTNRMIRSFVAELPPEEAAQLRQKNSELVEYQFSSGKEVVHEL